MTAPPEPTPSATSQPPASPPPQSDGRLRPDAFAVTVTDNLRVRSTPGVGDDSIKLEPLLWNGAVLWVIDGPVAASGYEWFLVRPIGEVDVAIHPDPPELGWVAAAGRDDQPWLAPFAFPCEATPWNLIGELEWPPHGLRGLACYGDAPLRFPAALGPGLRDCSPPSGLEPAWLDPCTAGVALHDPAATDSDPLRLHAALDPAVDIDTLPALDAGPTVYASITGQFDHPAASSCRLEGEPATDFQVRPPELVVLGCRSQFVLTAIDSYIDVDQEISGE